MFKAAGDYFHLEIVCPDWDIYQNFLYLKDIIWKGYFWKKHTLMLTFNFDFKNCQKIVP